MEQSEKTREQLLREIAQLKAELNNLTQEKRQTTQALERQIHRFDNVFTSAAVPISFVRLTDGQFVGANESFQQTTGYSLQELLTMQAANLWVSETKRQAIIKILVEQGFVSNFEYEFRTKVGEIRTAQSFLQVIDDDGEKLIFGISYDITERKRNQEAVERSEQLYRTLAQNFPRGGVILFDQDLRYTLVEGNSLGKTGIIPKHYEGHTIWEVLSLEEVSLTEPMYRAALEGRESDFETVWQGDHYEARVLPVRNEQDKIFAGMVVIYNVNERVVMTNALRQAEERLRTVINNTPVILFTFDREGVFTLVEGQALNILHTIPGLAVERLEGHSIFEVFASYPVLISYARRILAGETFSADTVSWPGHYMDFFGMPLRDNNGQIIGATGVAIDVTERRRIAQELSKSEERLRLSQRMEAVGRLAGGVAHDFNNLLSAILGYAGLISFGLEPDSPMLADVQEIERAAERAASLTRQLLAFSRRQVLQPEVLNLNGVVEEMGKLLRRLVGEVIDMQLQLDPTVGTVKADPSQLEQVLMNLAVNARDAMSSGGKLIIETSNVEIDETYAAQHVGVTPGSYVLLTVSDTGHGMDRATQTQIFEPFFTTKDPGQGTGLGLSTVYGIIKQSGGNVWVYSELGIGTTFKVYLPRVDEKVSRSRVVTPAYESLPRGHETILLVEDEEALRSLAHKVLIRNGYRVVEAADAEAALRIAQQTNPLDLLLTDMIIPYFNGQELARRVKVLHPTVQVLLMSGYTDNAMLNNGLLEPGTAFIQKPFTPDALIRRVRQTLDQIVEPKPL